MVKEYEQIILKRIKNSKQSYDKRMLQSTNNKRDSNRNNLLISPQFGKLAEIKKVEIVNVGEIV